MSDEKPGSIIGGALLIAGSCLGAGMLALPILTGLAGFFPSLLMFLCAWLFMTFSALLMVEINGWFTGQVNIITMAGHSLGRFGMGLSWILYLFLFYALLVAYISGSGNLTSTFLGGRLPIWLGSLFFVILFGYVVYLGTRAVDHWNRALMFGKIFAYAAMVALGVKYIAPKLLLRTEGQYAVFSLPVLIIAFGFQNMIPSITAYMKGDLKRVRITILTGSLFVLAVYVIWEIVVLGIVPLQGNFGIVQSLQNDQEASQALAGILGSSWVSAFAQALAFFAILTSFLAQALSLVHFLTDGFKIPYHKREHLGLCALALAPPLILSLIYPQLFFKALNFAGGICAVVLFGVLPVAIVWLGRYRKGTFSPYQVPGGKPLLIGIFLFAIFILVFQILTMCGFSYNFPS